MTAFTVHQIRWLAYVLLGASAIAAGLSFRSFLRFRRASYFFVREEAFRRLTIRLAWALALLTLAAILFLAAPYLSTSAEEHPEKSSSSGPFIPPTLTPSYPSPTDTPQPSPAPTSTPTLTPSPTATSTPEPLTPSPAAPTSTSEEPKATLTPVPARADAQITLQALAQDIDENNQPVDPGDTFPPGDYWIYLFFTYENMADGVQRSFEWYRNGEFWERCSDEGLWEWGAAGGTYYWCHPSTGWEPGSYEIRVYVEGELQGAMTFSVEAEGE